MGTFSKSLASCGGFLVGSEPVVDFVRTACRPFLFTASGVPAALGAALAALRVAREEEWRREAVRERGTQLRRGLFELGYDVGGDHGTAILAVHVGDDWEAARLWRGPLSPRLVSPSPQAPPPPPSTAHLRPP